MVEEEGRHVEVDFQKGDLLHWAGKISEHVRCKSSVLLVLQASMNPGSLGTLSVTGYKEFSDEGLRKPEVITPA